MFKVTQTQLFDAIRMITSNVQVSDRDMLFVTEFYCHGIVGDVVSWIQKGMKSTPEYIASQLKKLLKGTKLYISNFVENE